MGYGEAVGNSRSQIRQRISFQGHPGRGHSRPLPWELSDANIGRLWWKNEPAQGGDPEGGVDGRDRLQHQLDVGKVDPEVTKQSHYLLNERLIFFLPYLALTLVRRQVAWLGIILLLFYLHGLARSHNLSRLDPFYSYLLIPKERKHIWFELDRTQVLLLHKQPLWPLDHGSSGKNFSLS